MLNAANHLSSLSVLLASATLTTQGDAYSVHMVLAGSHATVSVNGQPWLNLSAASLPLLAQQP